VPICQPASLPKNPLIAKSSKNELGGSKLLKDKPSILALKSFFKKLHPITKFIQNYNYLKKI
jgi:hypothetical protein